MFVLIYKWLKNAAVSAGRGGVGGVKGMLDEVFAQTCVEITVYQWKK